MIDRSWRSFFGNNLISITKSVSSPLINEAWNLKGNYWGAFLSTVPFLILKSFGLVVPGLILRHLSNMMSTIGSAISYAPGEGTYNLLEWKQLVYYILGFNLNYQN